MTPTPLNAALAWSALAVDWLEMMSASGHVISHRTRRNPTPAEWFRIGSEKMEAAVESANGMARASVGFPTQDPLAMWHAWARVLSSGMAPYHSRAVRNSRARRRIRR